MSNENFEPGDMAYLTKTSTGKNVGIVGQLIDLLGPYEDLGDTWFVRSKEPIATGCSEAGNVNEFSRFRHPSSWMKKILPPGLDTKSEE